MGDCCKVSWVFHPDSHGLNGQAVSQPFEACVPCEAEGSRDPEMTLTHAQDPSLLWYRLAAAPYRDLLPFPDTHSHVGSWLCCSYCGNPFQ